MLLLLLPSCQLLLFLFLSSLLCSCSSGRLDPNLLVHLASSVSQSLLCHQSFYCPFSIVFESFELAFDLTSREVPRLKHGRNFSDSRLHLRSFFCLFLLLLFFKHSLGLLDGQLLCSQLFLTILIIVVLVVVLIFAIVSCVIVLSSRHFTIRISSGFLLASVCKISINN